MNQHRQAVAYLQRGWYSVPLAGKNPDINGKGWKHLRFNTEAEIRTAFRPGRNIGVLLGEPSGWLVDIDLDHSIAVELAPDFLFPTNAIFGRAGKPKSHYLYVAKGAETYKRQAKGVGMLIELRSTGGQTMFPLSIHPDSKERVQWHAEGEPAGVDALELKCVVDEIADEVERRLGIGKSEEGRIAHQAPRRNGYQKKPGLHRSSRLPAEERARLYISKMPPAVSGSGGHGATFDVACTLIRGFQLSDVAAWNILQEYNARCCVPPWSEKELAHKLNEAINKSHRAHGYITQEARPCRMTWTL